MSFSLSNKVLDQEAIIRGCKQGSEKAFKALVDQYAPILMAICMRYVNDQDLAKDALQESLISIFKNIQSYSGLGSFEGWIKRITVNACLKEIRMKRPLQELVVVDLQIPGAERTDDVLELNDLIDLIGELPDILRIVFNLHVVEGYSHAEIADMIQVAESSSRVYLTRARKWLQERITNKNNVENVVLNYKS